MSENKELDKTEHIAIPKRNETEESFIKNELSKSGMSIQEWVKDVVPLIIKNGTLQMNTVKDWSVYSSIKHLFVTEDATKKETESNDSAKSNTTETVSTPSQDSIAVIEDVDEIAQPEMKGVQSLGNFSRSEGVYTTNKEVIYSKIIKVGEPKDKHFILELDYPQIKSFTGVKEFIINLEGLVDTLFSKCKIIMAQPESVDRYKIERTEWGYVGLDLSGDDMITLMGNKVDLVSKLKQKTLGKESSTGKITKSYFSVQDRLGRILEYLGGLLYNIDKIRKKTTQLVSTIRSMFTSILARSDLKLKDMPSGFTKKFSLYDYRVNDPSAYLHLIRTMTGIRNYALMKTKDAISKRILVEKVQDETKYVEILKTMRVSTTIFSAESGVAVKINAQAARNFLMNYCLALTCHGLVRLDMTLDPNSLSPIQMFDVICAPCVIPDYCMDSETRRGIRNAFAIGVLGKMKVISDPVTDYDSTQEYLPRFLSRIKDKSLRNYISAYFNLFATGGTNGVVNCTVTERMFLGRKIKYRRPYGRIATSNNLSKGFTLLGRMMNGLNNAFLFNQTDWRAMSGVFSLLKKIVSRSRDMKKNQYYIERLVSTLSASPYVYPTPLTDLDTYDRERVPDFPLAQRSTIDISPAGISSFLYLLTMDSEVPKAFPIKEVLSGNHMFGYFNEVSERYYYAKSVYSLDAHPIIDVDYVYFDKKDYCDYAFATVEYQAPGSMGASLKEDFLAHSSYGLRMPMTKVPKTTTKVKASLRKFVVDNPHDFGYTNSVVLAKATQLIKDAQGRRFVISSNYYPGTDYKIPLKTYSLGDIDKLGSKGTFGMTLLKDQKFANIKFNIPIPISYKRYVFNPNAEDRYVPFTFSSIVSNIKGFTVYYDHTADYVYVENYPIEFIKNPKLVLDSIKTNKIKPETQLVSMISMKKRFTSNLKFWTTDQLFETYTPSLF